MHTSAVVGVTVLISVLIAVMISSALTNYMLTDKLADMPVSVPDVSPLPVSASTEDIKVLETQTSVPPGTIVSFAGNTVPDGWLLCDGTDYAPEENGNLFSVIGYTYGQKDTNFKVPDTRGVFLRGLDSGAGRDVARQLGEIQLSRLPDSPRFKNLHIGDWVLSQAGGGALVITRPGANPFYLHANGNLSAHHLLSETDVYAKANVIAAGTAVAKVVHGHEAVNSGGNMHAVGNVEGLVVGARSSFYTPGAVVSDIVHGRHVHADQYLSIQNGQGGPNRWNITHHGNRNLVFALDGSLKSAIFNNGQFWDNPAT